MEVFKIKGILTKEDVEKINEIMPVVVEMATTKGQDPTLIASLSSKIKIRIKDEEEKGLGQEKEIRKGSLDDEMLYSPEELSSVITTFKEIEKGIDPSFSDVDASLYTYMELIKKVSPINIQELGKDDNLIDNNSLLALTKQRAFPTGFAKVYQEAMKRLGIPCKIIIGDNGYAWNEIEINGTYYPLDLTSDAEYYRSEDAQGELGICKFLTDKEFYFDPLHKTSVYSEKELKNIRALEDSEIGKALEKIEYARRKRERKPRPELKIASKTLAEVVKGGVINPDTVSEIETVKISVTNDEVKEIAADLSEIGKYYPELLDNVILENTTGAKVDMQAVVDSIYESRVEAAKQGGEVRPVELTISSSNAEDFDLDFSKVPKTNLLNNTPTEENRKTKVVLKNTAGTPLRISNLNGKLSENIDVLDLTDFDLDGLDLTDSRIKSLVLRGDKTVNAAKAKGFTSLFEIALDATNITDFNSIYADITSSTSNVHDVTIQNIDLANRKILEELSNNPNLARITINNCNLNDIDGLENFDGRIAHLYLSSNDLNVTDLGRICRFIESNPKLDVDLSNNTGIRNTVASSRQMSDDSYNYIKKYFQQDRSININNKTDAFDMMLMWFYNVPYYINDAELFRDTLQYTRNPIMLRNDDDLDNVDFTVPYLQGATLLLTIPQVERLISSGKTIPQNVRIKIEDVRELTAERARELTQLMSNNGNTLSGVQIFDREGANDGTNIAPYTMSEYVYIKETLDNVVAGIDPSEPDIDKFATIYDRLWSKITYDTSAIEHEDFAGSMYYAEKIFTARNLLAGLQEETCVCAGYADILRNALLMVGIDARYNGGTCINKITGSQGGHAWNQVLLDDGTGTGTKKWYYTDLTWDAQTHRYDWTLLGDHNFKSHAYRDSFGYEITHDITSTQNVENCTYEDYDRTLLREAIARARARNQGYDYMNPAITIDIPDDPDFSITIDQDRIAEEYSRRKNDMYAKFYGDKDYEEEYNERNIRYRDHEVERVDAYGIVYRTIEDYPEREDDERFLLLDKYKDALERMTRYDAGDTSVYQGNQAQIDAQLESDREYVETRNHTFDQHKNTYNDLATLGKYGERMPYIQRRPGIINNITRVVGNIGIFTRNLVAPVYRAIGRYVAQPIHRLVTRGRDASPYKNNFYHRMVARRDYFAASNEAQNPGHPFRNFVKSRVDAIFKSAEGNEAVLRAGAADIRRDIEEQETEKAIIQNLERRSAAFDIQIQNLEQQLIDNPHVANEAEVRQAIADKTTQRDTYLRQAEYYRKHGKGMEQTDAISDKQHAIASKEVNTMRVTVIKGVAKGVAAKYVGPAIEKWILDHSKIKTKEWVEPTTKEEWVEPTTKQEWVEPTTKQEWVDETIVDKKVPVFEDGLPQGKTVEELIAENAGKDYTGWYSVSGGRRGATGYTLSGDEKVTGWWVDDGSKWGTGVSDSAGLTAPTLTDRLVQDGLMDANGVFRQDVEPTEILRICQMEGIDPSKVYVSVGDNHWAKAADLFGLDKVQVGEKIVQEVVPGHFDTVDVPGYFDTVDVPGHFDTVDVPGYYKDVIIDNPRIVHLVQGGKVVARTAMAADSVHNVAENLRNTTTDVNTNKSNPRQYTYDVDLDDIPKSRREYRDRER